jgi:riboflavin kinase / FMN adenylyltransferase
LPLPLPLVFGSEACTPPLAASAVAVGNFDGVHLGHAAIARRLRRAADRAGVPAVALTFDPHPAAIVRPGTAPLPLTTPARRAELLLALGLDAVLVQPAVPALMQLTAESFYQQILRGSLAALAFVEGQDFRFGAGRAGDVALLARLAEADGASLEVVDPVLVDGEPVSSSRLRRLVAAGGVAAAADLGTAPLRATGRVVVGARRGTGLGFPTANLAEISTLLPAPGVYAARAAVAGEVGRRWRPAAVHLGPAPTFDSAAASVEVHLIGFAGDLYDHVLDVDFLDRLRDTQRFASPAELKTQLAADVARAAALADEPAATTAREM